MQQLSSMKPLHLIREYYIAVEIRKNYIVIYCHFSEIMHFKWNIEAFIMIVFISYTYKWFTVTLEVTYQSRSLTINQIVKMTLQF